MSIEDKIFYNEASATKLGWTPEWFGCEEFDDELLTAIATYQDDHDLTPDGLCGPGTFRRIYVQRISEIDYHAHKEVESRSGNAIIYNGEPFPIEWDKVVLWTEEGGLKAKKYSDYTGKPKRDIKMFVVHWDVCTSSQTCQKVLDRRGCSVTFLLGADGTIQQTCDMQHATWHAGRSLNRKVTGIEVNCAYYPKYGPWYIRHGFGERPIWEGKVHGTKLKPHLGFYPVQIEALKALLKAVSLATGMPLQTPDTDTVHPPARRGDYRGVVHHYQLTRGKIDSAGPEGWLAKAIEEIKDAT